MVSLHDVVAAGKYEGWLPDLFLGKRLWGGTVGIIGAGRIGATYAKMLAPGHQMDVVYYDIFPNASLEEFFTDYSVRNLSVPALATLPCALVAG
eukprot:SAG31_NODE_14501_length_803_cov_0.954545_1_plen_94_part_00